MEHAKNAVLAASILLVTLVAGLWPTIPWDPPSVPLDGQSLAVIRGTDLQYFKTDTATCASLGLMALSQLYGGTWAPENGCGVANIGFGCGGCTVVMSRSFGIQGVLVGNGQQNGDVGACGNVEGGTCSVTNPGGYPLDYACTGIVVAVNPNTGQPYACSDLIAIMNQ